jgi:glycosyltransferase involved in cell wall biosynthesis
MPTYNSSPYLQEAIESVLKQRYTDYEFIIVDNCSTDDTVDIINRYAASDRRIQLSVNSSNIGPVNNLNVCLQKSQGEYIKYLLSDDVLSSDVALERMVSILDADDDISLVATARSIIDQHSNIIKISSEYKEKIGYAGTEIIQDCLVEQKNKIGDPSGVMFRRKHAIRGFNGKYRQAVDLEMWFHILEQGNFAYIHEPLCSFREHPDQQTKKNISNRISLIDEPFLLLQTYAAKPYLAVSRVRREFMLYTPVYSIWKMYKKKMISKGLLVDKIKAHYSLTKFIVLYPLFKAYRVYYKISQERFA